MLCRCDVPPPLSCTDSWFVQTYDYDCEEEDCEVSVKKKTVCGLKHTISQFSMAATVVQ